jgi:hypothetical protein
VTVTKDDGIVPSMSVAWRQLETLVTSRGDTKTPLPQDKGGDKRRAAGITIPADKLSADPENARGLARSEEWMPRTHAVVSR